MRIIAGSRARITLIGPRDLSTRPITDRVKESLFSILQWQIKGAMVADLFCGTGSLGLESLSRGAQHALMVDQDRDAVKRLTENIAKLKFEGQTTVRSYDSFRHGLGAEAAAERKYNLVFLDPPYRLSVDTRPDGKIGLLLNLLSSQVADSGVVVVRTSGRVDFLENYDNLHLEDVRKYGSMKLNFFQRVPDERNAFAGE